MFQSNKALYTFLKSDNEEFITTDCNVPNQIIHSPSLKACNSSPPSTFSKTETFKS